jgi:hypothetical protein
MTGGELSYCALDESEALSIVATSNDRNGGAIGEH